MLKIEGHGNWAGNNRLIPKPVTRKQTQSTSLRFGNGISVIKQPRLLAAMVNTLTGLKRSKDGIDRIEEREKAAEKQLLADQYRQLKDNAYSLRGQKLAVDDKRTRLRTGLDKLHVELESCLRAHESAEKKQDTHWKKFSQDKVAELHDAIQKSDKALFQLNESGHSLEKMVETAIATFEAFHRKSYRKLKKLATPAELAVIDQLVKAMEGMKEPSGGSQQEMIAQAHRDLVSMSKRTEYQPNGKTGTKVESWTHPVVKRSDQPENIQELLEFQYHLNQTKSEPEDQGQQDIARHAMLNLIQHFSTYHRNRLPDQGEQNQFVKNALALGDLPLARSLAAVYNTLMDFLKTVHTTDHPLEEAVVASTIGAVANEMMKTRWITTLVNHPGEPELRRIGVLSLAAIADPMMRDKFIYQACFDPHPRVREAGFSQLGHLTDNTLFRQLAKQFPGEAHTVLEIEVNRQAEAMAKQIQQFHSTNPNIRQALNDIFSDGSHLPTADEIKNQFGIIARQYLQPLQPWYRRWLGRSIPPEQVMSIKHLLIMVASETGSMMAIGIKPEHVSLIKQVYDKRVEVESKLSKAKHLYADQLMIQAQSDQEYDYQNSLHDQAKKQFVEAGKKRESDPLAFRQSFGEMTMENTRLKEAEEKRNHSRNGTIMALHHIHKLTKELRSHHFKLSQAIHASVMGANYQEIKDLVDSSETLVQDAATAALLDKTELEKARMQVDQLEMEAQQAGTQVKADTVLDDILNATESTPPKSQQNTVTFS